MFLACGFTPLHLETLLAAHLQRRLPNRRVTVNTGLYADLPGTLEKLADTDCLGVAVALEWEDCDPRLGYRSAGPWGPEAVADILGAAPRVLSRITAALEKIPASVPVALSLPTLPLPPIFHTSGWQAAAAELALRRDVLEFALHVSERKGLLLSNLWRMDEESPAAARLDLKSDLAVGLPYSVSHADAIAGALTHLLMPSPPKKGLITDLDDTLWHGLAGEIGPDQVSWDLASHHQLHGLYQKVLASLAEEGIFIGIASKNDPAVVERALKRPDLLLPPSRVFPVEVHWNAKSASVGRILGKWNVGADSVVFVDDSPMELAEVAAAHPGIECLHFPANDPPAGLALFRRLRDLFGKPHLSGDDALRLESIRQNTAFQQSAGGASAESFLQAAAATISIDFCPASSDPRILELVNKTNQFNLNGVRYNEAEWCQRRSRDGALLAAASYQDKFGPLGKIAVIAGRQDGDVLYIYTWVMSCRVFSRRIEHQCLKWLFEKFRARQIAFDFVPTPKNGPLQQFFESLTGVTPATPVVLSREQFEGSCPLLYHRVVETSPDINSWIPTQLA